MKLRQKDADDADWHRAAQKSFLNAYDDEDSVYDELRARREDYPSRKAELRLLAAGGSQLAFRQRPWTHFAVAKPAGTANPDK